MPKPDQMKFTFRDFQKILQHGLVGMTLRHAREDENEKKKLEDWLEQLCTESLQHVYDMAGAAAAKKATPS
jgi:hypothetical protein